MRVDRQNQFGSTHTGHRIPAENCLEEAESLYRSGRTREAVDYLADVDTWQLGIETLTQLRIIRGMALFDLGEAVESIATLSSTIQSSSSGTPSSQFDVAFALFVRETDFLSPDEALPGLTRLRQLATLVGSARSLSGLHLAVARFEGIRGHCVDAHRHLEIARRFAEQAENTALRCSVDLVDGSLESIAGNLIRSKSLAESCYHRAEAAGYSKYIVGSLANIAVVSLYAGQVDKARACLESVLAASGGITYVRFGALDSLAHVALSGGDLQWCSTLIDECAAVAASNRLPARSWYDLAHDLTRCAYFERLEAWNRIIEIVDEGDPELARRQYKALRTALLCAKARALAHIGKYGAADAALAGAVRACPRGAVDPLIVLEASKALCTSLRGDRSNGAVHFDRALAACRAIGHRYHEAWIDRMRAELTRATRESVKVEGRQLDVTDASLLLSDVATILGAGHSIDLLAHRMSAILKSTSLSPRVEVEDESGCEYVAEPSASWTAEADGAFRICLRGSDRRVAIRVRGVQTIDEISLLKSVADLVQAAVNRTADTESEDEDQNLWPRTVVPQGEDTIFRSPRMIEFLKIAARLATTDVPVLITGETGTGKEIIARLIHDYSKVKRGPFQPYNCASVPRDLVESQLFGHRRGAFTGATDPSIGVIRAAERGTLFLDEIGDLDPGVQPKLLRFLESGEIHPVGDVRPQHVTVRLVAATNANISRLVSEGRFRADLFYRIGVAPLSLPPLRERKDEIPALASLFLTRYARECGRNGLRLGDDLIAALLLYDWPGNIRQLANEIRRVVALAADGDTLSCRDLGPEVVANWNARPLAVPVPSAPTVQVRLDQTLTHAMADLEQRFIEHALQSTGGRVAEAANLLGLSRKGLFLKRRRRGLVPN